jgi:hypothetical protein
MNTYKNFCVYLECNSLNIYHHKSVLKESHYNCYDLAVTPKTWIIHEEYYLLGYKAM